MDNLSGKGDWVVSDKYGVTTNNLEETIESAKVDTFDAEEAIDKLLAIRDSLIDSYVIKSVNWKYNALVKIDLAIDEIRRGL